VRLFFHMNHSLNVFEKIWRPLNERREKAPPSKDDRA
jgi:hypothetical protein